MPRNVSCPYLHFHLTGTVAVRRRRLRNLASSSSDECSVCCGCSGLSRAVPRFPLSISAHSPRLCQPRGDLANALRIVSLFQGPRACRQTGRKTKHHPLIILRKHKASLMWSGYRQRTNQLSAFFQRLQAVHPRKPDTFVVNLMLTVQRRSCWTNELTDYVPKIVVVIYP